MVNGQGHDTARRKVKWPIARLAVVLDANAKPANAMRFLLALHRRGDGCWVVHPAGRPGSQFRFTSCLFLFSALAYDHLQQGQHGPTPEDVVLLRGNDDEFGHVAKYYYDLKMADTRDGAVLAYKQLPLNLRCGVRSIFWPAGRTARRKDAEIQLPAHTSPDAVSFWWLDKSEAGVIENCAKQGIKLAAEQIPGILIPVHEVQRMKTAICGTPEWARWKAKAEENRRRAKKTGVLDRLRAHLHTQALSHLRDGLQPDGPDDWVELRLMRGRLPRGGEAQPNMTAQQPSIGSRIDPGRIWKDFDRQQLWTARESHFLTTVSGGGKTTFLRYIQRQCLENGRFLPVFVRAPDLLGKQTPTWESIRLLLLRQFSGLACRTALRSTFDTLYAQANILFLIDRMDGLAGLAPAIMEAVQSKRTARSNPVLMAGRPTTACMVNYGSRLKPLCLEAFDRPACETFFGEELYSRAIGMCKGKEAILETPMHASMVRSLLTSGEETTIHSLWDLYSKFVANVPSIQPQDRNPKVPDEPIQRIFEGRTALGCIAYEAMTQSPPLLQDIPVEFAAPLLPHGVSVDSLARTGLADVHGPPLNRNAWVLVFSHQSFQEFFAAQWASKDEPRVNNIIREYWNPDWESVLRFLVGANRFDVLERIYPSDEVDNPIHSRLFLAAKIAGDTELSSELEDRLIDGLSSLAGVEPFRCYAIRGLIQMDTKRSHAIAWSEVSRHHYRVHSPYPSESSWLARIPSDILAPLYHPEYLATMISKIHRHPYFFPPGYDSAMLAWREHVPEEEARTLIDECLHSPSSDIAVTLAPVMDTEQVSRLVDTALSGGAWSIMASCVLLNHGSIPSEEISRLVSGLFKPKGHVNLAITLSLLSSVEDRLDNQHVMQLLDSFWDLVSTCGNAIPLYLPQVCAQFPMGSRRQFIDRLDDADTVVASAAAIALRHFAHPMGNVEVEELMRFAASGAIRPEITETLLSVIESDNAAGAHALLMHLEDQEAMVRTTVMEGMWRIEKHVSPYHLGQIGENLKRATQEWAAIDGLAPKDRHIAMAELRAATMALARNARQLNDKEVSSVIESLDWLEGFPPYSEWETIDTLRSFRSRLTSAHVAAVLAKLERAQAHPMVAALGVMLPREAITNTQVSQLVGMLQRTSASVRCEIAAILELVHEYKGVP